MQYENNKLIVYSFRRSISINDFKLVYTKEIYTNRYIYSMLKYLMIQHYRDYVLTKMYDCFCLEN